MWQQLVLQLTKARSENAVSQGVLPRLGSPACVATDSRAGEVRGCLRGGGDGGKEGGGRGAASARPAQQCQQPVLEVSWAKSIVALQQKRQWCMHARGRWCCHEPKLCCVKKKRTGAALKHCKFGCRCSPCIHAVHCYTFGRTVWDCMRRAGATK